MSNKSNLQLALVAVHHRCPLCGILALKVGQRVENCLVRWFISHFGKIDSDTLSCVPLAESILRLSRRISN